MARSWILSGCVVIIICIQCQLARAQSCGPKVKPRFFVGIPCDMMRSTFCSAAGSAYPWNSLRRYIYENQGLMRRMYGNERHSLILHSDLQTRSYSSWNNNKIRTGRVSSRNKENVTIPDDILPDRYRRGNATSRATTAKPKNATSTQNLTETKATTASTNSVTSTETADTKYPVTSTGAIVTDQVAEEESYQYHGTGSVLDSEYDDDYDSVSTTPGFQPISTTTLTSSDEAYLQEPTTEQPIVVEDKMYYNTQSVDDSHVLSSNSVEEKEAPPETTEATKEDEIEPQKGFNACPVKEEVIAPYWANNTRGETLALLNVYPFEQYVHWEKCAYENHQMFCRDGCRCEQQFRLHRLLAFDPRNECRGIFADWFRFPSCCVCVCYNLTDTVPKF